MAVDSPPAKQPFGFHTGTETIVSHDGTKLKAIVIAPDGKGPFPLLVMPSSWAVERLEYVGAAVKLAHDSDYIVVSYTSRGFWNSGGEIDIAGGATVEDVRAVIKWALKEKLADEDRIGVVGISYGAGTALLAAAEVDPIKIKAVAAMSTWTSLGASLYPNRTVSSQAAEVLLWVGHLTGRFGDAMKQMQQDYKTNQIEKMLPLLLGRSPAALIDKINANKPAVFIANAWEDALFRPSQVVDFYDKLTCTKRLMLAPGDHATAELPGLIGLPNDPWFAVRQWMDYHLRSIGTIDEDVAVTLKSADRGGWHSYPNWSAASAARTTRYLTEPVVKQVLHPKTGSLNEVAAPGWECTIEAGISTSAESGDALITGTLEAYFGDPPAAFIPLIRRSAAGVWCTERLSASALLSGSTTVHLTVTPSAPGTSLFFYLYDVDGIDLGRLITHVPYSLLEATPGVAQIVDVQLEPVAWRVRGGHCLALVVDTVDRRYHSASVAGSTVTISSPTGSDSYVSLPVAI